MEDKWNATTALPGQHRVAPASPMSSTTYSDRAEKAPVFRATAAGSAALDRSLSMAATYSLDYTATLGLPRKPNAATPSLLSSTVPAGRRMTSTIVPERAMPAAASLAAPIEADTLVSAFTAPRRLSAVPTHKHET